MKPSTTERIVCWKCAESKLGVYDLIFNVFYNIFVPFDPSMLSVHSRKVITLVVVHPNYGRTLPLSMVTYFSYFDGK